MPFTYSMRRAFRIELFGCRGQKSKLYHFPENKAVIISQGYHLFSDYLYNNKSQGLS